MRTADIPLMLPVRQEFARPRLGDISGAVGRELAQVFSDRKLLEGKRIGVTVGSRGISNIAAIAKAAIDFLKGAGAEPFIIPAMGSHGGGTSEGQRALIAHYGVTEETMGAPIRAQMETRVLGTVDGLEVNCAEAACDSDGILLLNRVKPHTDMKADVESGLTKIGAIGLGKLDGAERCHNEVVGMGLDKAIVVATSEMIRRKIVIGGLAILENAYHETAKIAAVGPENLINRERELLIEAKSLMPRLPLDEIDVLFIKRIGKNISGAGMDTNIVGRNVYGFVPGESWRPEMPSIFRIVVSELAEESNGNAIGMGLADFGTERLREQVDFYPSYLNAVTGFSPLASHLPVILEDDRAALATAIATSRPRRPGPYVVAIRDTLALTSIFVSKACRAIIEDVPGAEIVGGPQSLPYDEEGYVVWPSPHLSPVSTERI